jgi:hypothetical protein
VQKELIFEDLFWSEYYSSASRALGTFPHKGRLVKAFVLSMDGMLVKF